ncbi:MAG: alpha/beta hydrolase [Bacteroidales bacterium]|nr:alpha/beta hydrolase [Bacteroidales bacterium]
MKRFSNISIIQKGGRIMLIIFSFLLVCILILSGVLLVYSPGKAKPFLDESGKPLAGSISEKIFIDINGVRQGMFIKSKNSDNPVLLYLHGGMPDYFLSEKYPTGLEDYFTMVWWEQRGSGLSYSKAIPTGTVTPEQIISDTKEVTDYLRKRFGKEKIYLMGHSGGTFIGIQTAAIYPELYIAYLGVAQISNQLQSEKLAYDFMLGQFRDKGDLKMVKKLEASPVTLANGTPPAYAAIRDVAMHSLGIGTTHDMTSVISGIFFPSLKCREYTFSEKINMWVGKSRTGISIVWTDVMATDLSEKVTELKIPVYLFEGAYDYTCSSAEAKSYFEKLKAPVKGFYLFEKSAHSPFFEEPDKMQKIVREDVLEGVNNLADIK